MNIESRLGFIFRAMALAAVAIMAFISVAHAQTCFTVSPPNLQLQFPRTAVGTRSTQADIVIFNHCKSNLNLQMFKISSSEFQLEFGIQPESVPPGDHMIYAILFVPNSAQTFKGTFTVKVQGYNPVVVSMSGTGFITGAVASISPPALTFSNQSIGSSSTPQTVTFTNTGTSAMRVQHVYADPPFYVTGFTKAITLEPGQPLPIQVSFIPTFTGAYTNTLVMTSDVLSPKGAPLTGTATAASTLSVATYPVLPGGTSGFAYQATLLAAAGTAPYSWSLANGARLPSGLSLSSSGVITGSIASSVGAGNYPVTVQVTDSSSPPNNATSLLTLPVSPANGASCNNIIFDVPGTSTPIAALNDLGTGYYLGAEGGLYLNGSNTMPAGHDSDGVTLAQAIQPLAANGNPDPNGKIGLISLGMSDTFDTWNQFMQDAEGDISLNSHLAFASGAQPGVTAVQFADPHNGAWSTVMDYFLPQSGITANQVQVAWFMDIDASPHGTFPGDNTALESEYIAIAQNLHTFFPNLKLLYFSSRFYGGYSNGLLKASDPETYAYESGFAVQAVIQDQINGDAALNYNSANGPVMAPWIAWGPYDWANGMLGRSDGLVWACDQFRSDGTHLILGREQDANLLLNFFKTADTTMPWFMAPVQKLSNRRLARPTRVGQ